MCIRMILRCRNITLVKFEATRSLRLSLRSDLLRAVAVGVLAVLTTVSQEIQSANGTIYWSTASGDWSVDDNWGGTEPTSDHGAVIDNGGTADITQWNEACYHLYLGSTKPDDSGTVKMTGGSLSAYREYIGNYGMGRFTQSGGTHTVSSNLTLASRAGSKGTYDLQGGTLALRSLTVGAGTAAFNFGGGTLQASGDFSTSVPMTLSAIGGNANIDAAGYSVTVSSVLSGMGGLSKLGTGTLTLSGMNEYTGGTNLAAGILRFVNGSLGSSGNIVFTGSSTLAWNGTNTQDTSSRIRINDGVTATLDTGNNAISLAHDIGLNSSGANSTGSMVKAGTGSLALTGVNTHSGGTTVTAGTLSLTTGNNRLAATGAITITGGILDLGGNYQETSGNVSFQGGAVQNGTLKKNGDAFEAWAGAISATLADGETPAGLIKTGEGTTMLTGVNTYTDSTIVNRGTLTISSTAALPGWNAMGRYRVAPGAILAVGDAVSNEDAVIMLDTGSFGVGSALGFDVTITRVVDSTLLPATVGLAKSGAGTLTLTNVNATTSGPLISSGSGILDLGGFTQETSGDIVMRGGTVQNGTLRKNGGNFDAQAGTISANLADGANSAGLIKTGSGTLTLSGNNTYSDGTILREGRLSIKGNTALGTGTLSIGGTGLCEITVASSTAVSLPNDNSIVLNGDFTFGDGPSLNLGAGPVALNADCTVTCTMNTLTVGGVISGDYCLTKSGGGYLALNGINTHSGGTRLLGGQLHISNGQALGTGDFKIGGDTSLCTLRNTSGSRITLSNNNPIVLNGGLNKVTFVGGEIDLGVGQVTMIRDKTKIDVASGTEVRIGGCIVGDGLLIVGDGGGGMLVLAGSNTYSGGTYVHGATLHVTHPGALPGYDTPGKVRVRARLAVNYGGGGSDWASSDVDTLRANASFEKLSCLGLDTTNATAGATYGSTIHGWLRLEKLGENTLVLSCANAHTGRTKIFGGSLVLANADALRYSMLDYDTYGGSLSFGTLNAATLGGLDGSQNLTLTNENSEGVMLNVGMDEELIWDTDNSYAHCGDYYGVLSGSGGLTKIGSGTLALSNANTYTGMTRIEGGTLLLKHAQALGTTTLDYSNDNGSLSFGFGSLGAATLGGISGCKDLALAGPHGNPVALSVGVNDESTVYSGTFSGSGSLTKAGTGTLTLLGANSYLSGTVIGNGTLNVGNANGSATGPGTVQVNAGAKLSGSGIIAGSVLVAGTLSPGDGTGVLTVENKVAFQAGSTFDVEVNGFMVGSDYDQLLTTGPVTLAGSLAVSFDDFAPTGHDILFLINNTGSGTTTGMFQYEDNARIATFKGYDWHITYDANNAALPSLDGGNDVAVYSVHAVPEPSPVLLLVIGATIFLSHARSHGRPKNLVVQRKCAQPCPGTL